MRSRFTRLHYTLHFVGNLLKACSLTLLLPLATVLIFWGKFGDGWRTAMAFLFAAAASLITGFLLTGTFRSGKPDILGSMLICSLGWLVVSAFGALPYVLAIRMSFLDGYFESMSGFTTTGITLLSGLYDLPRSILFWRSLTQWLGGLGILSFFLAIVFRGSGAHYLFGAESHKIFSKRPTPGLYNTLKILMRIYGGFTLFFIIVLSLEGMPLFEAVCHAFAALSTGGFSPHDASIAFYSLSGHPHYRLIEYTVVLMMLIGGMNFLIHHRLLSGDFKAFWDNMEIRYWWKIIVGVTLVIMVDILMSRGSMRQLLGGPTLASGGFEEKFRHVLFQVISIVTTTGFATRDISSNFFPSLSKQLFLMLMVFGGCVGSTGGGIKMMRVAILNSLIKKEVFRLRVSDNASSGLVIDGRIVPEEEVRRVSALLLFWMIFLVLGGGITAFLSHLGPLESFSGMFSALGNIGPCYISGPDMIAIHPLVKATYILGMLLGRLEILPVLLIFNRKAW